MSTNTRSVTESDFFSRYLAESYFFCACKQNTIKKKVHILAFSLSYLQICSSGLNLYLTLIAVFQVFCCTQHHDGGKSLFEL